MEGRHRTWATGRCLITVWKLFRFTLTFWLGLESKVTSSVGPSCYIWICQLHLFRNSCNYFLTITCTIWKWDQFYQISYLKSLTYNALIMPLVYPSISIQESHLKAWRHTRLFQNLPKVIILEICVKFCVKIPNWPVGLGSKVKGELITLTCRSLTLITFIHSDFMQQCWFNNPFMT